MLVDVLDRSVEKVFVSKDERLSGNSSSIGNQIKWKHGSKFIKLNAQGYEDIAEVMVSNLLYFTNLQKHEFVMYYSCVKVIGKSYRGYDLEDEYGNRVIETGYDSIG